MPSEQKRLVIICKLRLSNMPGAGKCQAHHPPATTSNVYTYRDTCHDTSIVYTYRDACRDTSNVYTYRDTSNDRYTCRDTG